MKEILEILENDARATPERISTMTGIPLAEVKKTISEAEKNHTIVKYKAMINWHKAGDEQGWAVIEVRIPPQRNVGFDAIADRIYRFPEVRSTFLLSGPSARPFFVSGRTMQDVASFVSQRLAPIEGVQGTTTHFLLKRYKEDGEIMEAKEENKRLPLTM